MKFSNPFKRNPPPEFSPAFPCEINGYANLGMSMRAYLAGQALAGLCFHVRSPEDIAADALAIADATIKELEKE